MSAIAIPASRIEAVDNMVEAVSALFEHLVAELPPGTAVVHVRQLPRDGSVVEVKPTNPACADFGVHTDGVELFSFGFGPRSQWEFPWQRRYRNGEKDVVTEIGEMSRAIIAGNCELTRGPFWLTGKIHVGDYTYKQTDLPMLPIPPFWTRHYAPYASITSAPVGQ